MVATKSWQGKIDLIYQYEKEATKLKSFFSQAPFKIQRSFYPEGKSICHSVIMHTAGGIVGGDILRQNITLLPNSQVLITTPAASKIYRSKENLAIQEIKIKLAENSYLEYLPQEAIVFNRAHFQQSMKVELATNASLLTWEINRFGRTARGEDFSNGYWSNRVEIWRGEKPLWIEQKYLQGDRHQFYSLNGLRGKPVVGTLVFVPRQPMDNLTVLVRDLITPMLMNQYLDVTTIQGGIICRYHGDSVSLGKKSLITIWQFLRQTQNLTGNLQPRIWQ